MEIQKTIPGTEIENITVIAGKGTNKKIRDVKRLINCYNIPEEEWQKVVGTGYVMINKAKTHVELYWYQAEGNMYEMKVKGELTQ